MFCCFGFRFDFVGAYIHHVIISFVEFEFSCSCLKPAFIGPHQGLDTVILVLQLLTIPCIWIVPPQKREMQELLATGKQSPRAATALVVVLILCLLWSVSGNFMAVFPATSCLELVGGPGCSEV